MKNNNIKDVINSLSPSESTKQKIKANIQANNSNQTTKQSLSFRLKLAVAIAACALVAVIGLSLSSLSNIQHTPTKIQNTTITNEDASADDSIGDDSILASFVLTAYASNSDEGTSLSPNYMEETQKIVLQPNTKVLLAQYSPIMSSVPGFPFTFDVKYEGESNADIIDLKLTVDNGNLLDWDTDTWQIKTLADSIEIQSGKTLYWTPLSSDDKIIESASITVEAILNGEIVARQILYIAEDTDYYYYATVGDVEYP